MQRNSFIQLSDYSSIDDQETILNKIILKLDRVRKLSPSSHKLVPNKAVHPTNYFVPMKHKFTAKQDYIGDLEADYDNGNCHFHFLHLYLTVTYCLLISPYYPSRRDGHYNLIKNKFQKVSLIIEFHKWNIKIITKKLHFRFFVGLDADWSYSDNLPLSEPLGQGSFIIQRYFTFIWPMCICILY